MINMANAIQTTFFRPRVLLPVIHLARGVSGALESVQIAVDADADGVVLIDQGMSARQVLDLVPVLRDAHPRLWIGVNLLGCAPEQVVRLPEAHLLGGIWSDDAGVDSLMEERADHAAAAFRAARAEVGWTGLYFGGTAFKTQRDVPHDRLPWVARKAASFMEVVTTSGRGTGIAAEVDKVRILREALGDHPMALASGVTPENVGVFLPFVDAYLVATGIEEAFSRLCPERTRSLASRIHAYPEYISHCALP